MRQNNAPVRSEGSFGKFIQAKRIQLNLTQDEVALRAGTTQGYLSKVEKGMREPTLTLALKLCEVLGLDINDFVATQI